MGRKVYGAFSGLSVTAATQDLCSCVASSSHPVKLLGFAIFSADTAAENIRVELHHITAVGSGGSAGTKTLADKSSSASDATFRTLDTTQGASGGLLMPFEWEQVGALGNTWTPEMAPVAAVSNGFSVRWATATAATISGYICWEEL